jgi:hypothetical protein
MMRIMLFALATLTTGLLADVRPSAATVWYPWCARLYDRSGATSCAFTTFQQCQATVSGIGGACVQNWYPAPGEPRYDRHRRRPY